MVFGLGMGKDQRSSRSSERLGEGELYEKNTERFDDSECNEVMLRSLNSSISQIELVQFGKSICFVCLGVAKVNLASFCLPFVAVAHVKMGAVDIVIKLIRNFPP